MNIKRLNNIVNKHNWTFAKSMPGIPHYYIVTDWFPGDEDIGYLKNAINEFGYTRKFYSKEYKYLDIGEYKYWVIENIINRARIEEQPANSGLAGER